MYIKNLFKHWTYKIFAPGLLLREKYEAFRNLLESDKKSHELIAELEQIYYDQIKIDLAAVKKRSKQLSSQLAEVVESLIKLCPTCYVNLGDYFRKIDFYIKLALEPESFDFSPPFFLALDEITAEDRSLTGNKAFNLAMARQKLALPVPRGFVITANSYHYFIEANDLGQKINENLAQMDISSTDSLERASHELRRLILTAEIPEEIEAGMSDACKNISLEDGDTLRVSVRSSARGEDSKTSFAGQYKTVLNIGIDQIAAAYKEVVASKYSPQALFYRINHGLWDQEVPMAVLVLEMIDARASGVIYTSDPSDPHGDKILLHTIWGMGELLVAGKVTPSIVTVTRQPPHQIERTETVVQTLKAISSEGGDLQLVPGKNDQPASLALSDESVLRLSEWAMKLEELHGMSQDIEWCMAESGELFLLQARPLKVEDSDRQPIDCRNLAVEHRILLSGGTRASSGIGAGVVHQVQGAADLKSMPAGAVLVSKTASPDFVQVIGKLNGVVTDIGSAAGHFASVAREFGVPMLVNTGTATQRLVQGGEVTLYADAKVVYQGKVPQLLESECAEKFVPPDSRFAKKLQKILGYISPLNLVDPMADNFAPEGCKTFHDILRFAHEKAVQEMFRLGDRGSRRARGAKKLISEIPITVNLLDLKNGLCPDARVKKEVGIDEITSVPLRAVWKGLSHPDIYWEPNLPHFDWQEFDRISAGIVNIDRLGSYAIISRDYLNLNIHFGYHFVVLDTLCGDEIEANYIMLRFTGGGANFSSRVLRVSFLAEVLSYHGFEVEKKGDLIDARLSRDVREALKGKLEAIGILLGCTRLLDMALQDGSDVDRLVAKFLSGEYALSPISRK
jgi:pyruvate,water dikinase